MEIYGKALMRLAEDITSESSYSIWDLAECYEEYLSIQLDWREVKVGKDDIILMGGDIRGDWEIEFFHSMV